MDADNDRERKLLQASEGTLAMEREKKIAGKLN